MRFAFLNRMGPAEAMAQPGRPGRTAVAQVGGSSSHPSGDTSDGGGNERYLRGIGTQGTSVTAELRGEAKSGPRKNLPFFAKVTRFLAVQAIEMKIPEE